jgi:hypothetical protein
MFETCLGSFSLEGSAGGRPSDHDLVRIVLGHILHQALLTGHADQSTCLVSDGNEPQIFRLHQADELLDRRVFRNRLDMMSHMSPDRFMKTLGTIPKQSKQMRFGEDSERLIIGIRQKDAANAVRFHEEHRLPNTVEGQDAYRDAESKIGNPIILQSKS